MTTESFANGSLNFLVILFILILNTMPTNTRTSTLWKLNSDRTKIIEGDPLEAVEDLANGINVMPKFVTEEDPLFNIITSTERYGTTWVKHEEENSCSNCFDGETNKTKSNTNSSYAAVDNKQDFKDDHKLSCGKPVNFTFYDNLVGVMNRKKHPALMEPEVMVEFMKRYRLKPGKPFDFDVVENKLIQAKKEKPKSIGTLQQLGNYWRIKGDSEKVIECFRKALALSPHNAEVLLSLAKVLFHLQYLDDAIYLTRRSLEVAVPGKGAWAQYFTLGEIFKAYGHYHEAQIHLRHSLELNPGHEPAIKILKELQEVPSFSMHFSTFIIIICLIVIVIVLILRTFNSSERGFHKGPKILTNTKDVISTHRKPKKINT